ncbi:MAG: sodium-dependent transporter, partial [Stackebrandtia sp.]
MAAQREQWGTRAGFILAAVGSAIGLGNIWRFPATAYEAGGGAFLIPYLVALLTAGIPLLIFEYAVGHRTRSSPPRAFRTLSRAAQPLGWWQVAICFVIATYYAVIIAWALRYALFSLDLQWGDDTEGFFLGFLGAAESPGMISKYLPGLVVPLILVWAITLGILALGVKKGVERANKIFIPLLVVTFGALVVRSTFLDGAADGLNAFFTPDWDRVFDTNVWLLVYGQLFLSLSVGFGIMITYASYLRRRAELTGAALVAGFANSSFEILAGIGVFSALGYMATTTGVAVDDVVQGGPGLAFMALPQIVSEMPAGRLFGLLFFFSLVIAGLTSLISIVQVLISAVQDRTGWSRLPAVGVVGGFTAAVSIAVFPTDQGLSILDAADNFINKYGITLAALTAIVVVGWMMRKLPELRGHVNAVSELKLGVWWIVALGVITPLMLAWIIVNDLINELKAPYGEMPLNFLYVTGWGVAIGAIVFGLLASLAPWRDSD